jgi:hypothetical protein
MPKSNMELLKEVAREDAPILGAESFRVAHESLLAQYLMR